MNLPRPFRFLLTCVVVLFLAPPARSAGIPCRDLQIATAEALLATVTVDHSWSGGGVQIGKYDCDDYAAKTGCDWETELEDDGMLDPDHRLISVLSSHLTGSGSWWDILVFGCVAGDVKSVYQGQFGRWSNTGLESAPPALRPKIEDYLKHFRFGKPSPLAPPNPKP